MKKTRRSRERRRAAPRRSPRGSSSRAGSFSSSPASQAITLETPAPADDRSSLEEIVERFLERGRAAQIAADEILESFRRRASDVLNEPDDV